MSTITKSQLMERLAGLEQPAAEMDLTPALEKIASVDAYLSSQETKAEDLTEEEVLDLLGQAGVTQEELDEVLDAVAGAEPEVADEGEDEGMEATAAYEHEYNLGYARGAGFGDALEKNAGARTDAFKAMLGRAGGHVKNAGKKLVLNREGKASAAKIGGLAAGTAGVGGGLAALIHARKKAKAAE